MIDLTSEHLLTLSAAAKLLPKRRRGKRPHASTMYRWTDAGCNGIVLETIQIGGTRCTSRETLARFFHRLTARRERCAVTVSEASHAAADAELARAGI